MFLLCYIICGTALYNNIKQKSQKNWAVYNWLVIATFTRNEGVAGSNPVFSFGANAVDISVCAVFLYLFRNIKNSFFNVFSMFQFSEVF